MRGYPGRLQLEPVHKPRGQRRQQLLALVRQWRQQLWTLRLLGKQSQQTMLLERVLESWRPWVSRLMGEKSWQSLMLGKRPRVSSFVGQKSWQSLMLGKRTRVSSFMGQRSSGMVVQLGRRGRRRRVSTPSHPHLLGSGRPPKHVAHKGK